MQKTRLHINAFSDNDEHDCRVENAREIKETFKVLRFIYLREDNKKMMISIYVRHFVKNVSTYSPLHIKRLALA